MRFYTESLLSKWGFEDGYILWDLCGGFHHEALIEVVNKHMMPAIKNAISVRTIGTVHNPIRADFVDGVKVDDYNGNIPKIIISPEYVDVSQCDLLEIYRQVSQINLLSLD